MRNRPSWDEYFLKIADVVSDRSPDEETQVGCVIVDERNRIVATGYNGFPPGFPDAQLPARRPDKYPYMVHAEINAIASAKGDLSGATMYCTHSPCPDCAKAIATSGIRRLVCSMAYMPRSELFQFVQELLAHSKISVELLHEC